MIVRNIALERHLTHEECTLIKTLIAYTYKEAEITSALADYIVKDMDDGGMGGWEV